MPTLPSDATPKTDQVDQTDPELAIKKRNKEFKQRIDASKIYRRKLVANWTVNIDYRRGKPFASQTDEDRVVVNMDWSLTKAKQASLFSQVPAVRVSHPPQTVDKSADPWLHNFEQRINDTLIVAGIETAMDEALPDCINAAGIGIIMVSHESISEDVQVPDMDMSMMPPQLQQIAMTTGMLPNGQPVPMTTVPKIVDHRYVTARVSPADFLWPLSFTGSDFDNAPWIGHSGRIPWAEGAKRWGLKEADKDKYASSEDRTTMDRLTHDVDKDKVGGDEMICFDEIFYKEFQYDPDSKSFSTIHHLVFINGKDEPVTDEPWNGQQIDQDSGTLIGALRYPIRVLSLTYLTDEAIPPSDSAIGRPQVNELMKSRTQMILQRERSLPVRWVDVNRVDPTVLQGLMRGVWQGMIPVQGQGGNILGEVQRSAMPQENFLFDKIAKADLQELWQIGQSESGVNVETSGEAKAIAATMQTRVGRERAKVGKFFCSTAEVLGGLITVYEDPSSFGQGFDTAVSRTLSYSILADSTVLLDANQRLQRAIDFMNFGAKTGWVKLEPVLKEIATLSGFDPAVVIAAPEPKPPVEPNISLRLTGTEDMLNPLTLAFLMKSGQAPSPELIEQAKQLIISAVTPPPNAVPTPPQMDPMTGAPLPNQPPIPLPQPTGPPMPSPVPAPPPPAVGAAHPDLSALDRVNKRVIER